MTTLSNGPNMVCPWCPPSRRHAALNKMTDPALNLYLCDEHTEAYLTERKEAED